MLVDTDLVNEHHVCWVSENTDVCRKSSLLEADYPSTIAYIKHKLFLGVGSIKS